MCQKTNQIWSNGKEGFVLPLKATSTFFCLRFEDLVLKCQNLNVCESYKQIETFKNIFILGLIFILFTDIWYLPIKKHFSRI
jgi:hypothetical protein